MWLVQDGMKYAKYQNNSSNKKTVLLLNSFKSKNYAKIKHKHINQRSMKPSRQLI